LLGGDGAAAQDREGIAAGGGVTGDLLADLAFSDEQVVHDVSWVQWLIEMSRARARRWGGAGLAVGRGRPGGGAGPARGGAGPGRGRDRADARYTSESTALPFSEHRSRANCKSGAL